MVDIISAENARKKTQEVINNITCTELAYVKDLIEEAINKGKYMVRCYNYIGEETERILIENGYEVKHYFDCNEDYTTIRWGEC